jgi:nucleoside-diphosphate-sugar epimerase
LNKVLLTGASGFVGSHILDRLRARQLPAAVLLRPTSDRRFIERHLPEVEVRSGSISDPASLRQALAGISHVIHCAGCTRARNYSEFYDINHLGTRNVVEAVNAQPNVQQLVHISSLAVAGPATAAEPARESDPPHPISEYGKSKFAAELEVRERCRVPWTVVRPPAVYGPRDAGFFSMFQAVAFHLLPRPSATQALSLVFAPDLAEAIVSCLDHPKATGKVYFAASNEVVTGRRMAEEIRDQMGHWTVPCPMPAALLWPVCCFQEMLSRVTGKASLLNLQKYAELRAPGWVCDPSLLEREIGVACRTPLREGVAATLKWYREARWL